MSLSLSCARATITKVIPDRKADDDGAKYTTVALRIEVKCSTDILAEFHPSLKDALFRREGGVRFPPMKEVGWEGTRRGVDLAIRPAPDLKPAVTLADVKLRDFRLKAISEGTQDLVAMRFTADVENPSAPVGRILEYLKEHAWVDVKGGGELDLAPPSARERIPELKDAPDSDTKVTITGAGVTVETTAGELAGDAGGAPPVVTTAPASQPAATEASMAASVTAVRKLQIRRMGAQEKLATYNDEVLRAAIAAEEAAPNCRPLMVAMLRGELERRAEAKS